MGWLVQCRIGVDMALSIRSWFGDWSHLLKKPVSAKDAEQAVEPGSIPDFSFHFMLASSAVLATLGLLANSAAVIIGAMIVAPLMSPIISMSYGIVAGRMALTMRSLLTIFTGTLLTIGLAFVFTELVGWKIAGSEIVARMRPSLLDLGVAVASGAAAAFAYTRPNVSSALAGIAIAVALVPPLCTVGIALALGHEVRVEVGLAEESFSALGPFLLFLTNLIGIVFAGSLVFYWQYFRRQSFAMLKMALTLGCLIIVVPPLGFTMDNLLIRNQVYRSLIIEGNALIPEEYNVRFTNLSVRIGQDKNIVFVRGDLVAPPGLFTQQLINALHNKLSERVTMPVKLEFGIIHETTLRNGKGADSDG